MYPCKSSEYEKRNQMYRQVQDLVLDNGSVGNTSARQWDLVHVVVNKVPK